MNHEKIQELIEQGFSVQEAVDEYNQDQAEQMFEACNCEVI